MPITKRKLNEKDQNKRTAYPDLLPWAAVAATMLATAAIRTRLLAIPLERDEGEYAYAGQLMLQGLPPYSLAYNMKFPGIYAAYAAVMSVFGQSTVGIHLGLLVVNVVSILMVFFLGRRLYGSWAGAIASACYAVLTLGPYILGTSAHATHFVVVFALAGVLILLKSIDLNNCNKGLGLCAVSGFFMGLAMMMKQPGIFFIAFGVLYFIWEGARQRPTDWRNLGVRLSLYMAGSALPFLLTCLLLLRAGVFSKFWFWTFEYARQYSSEQGLEQGFHNFWVTFPKLVGSCSLIWGLAVAGVCALLWDKKAKSKGSFLFGFLALSFLAVCPGFWFREHYFVLLMPAIAIFAGIATISTTQAIVGRGWSALLRYLPTVVILIAIAQPLWMQQYFFFSASPIAACRKMYGINPFPESLIIADYIKDHTKPEDRIVVLGSEPQLYFYAQRHSATGYIYTYGLMEDQPFAQKMQKEMIQEIEQVQPEYLVFVKVFVSWLYTSKSPRLIFNWFDQYCVKNYTLEGAAEIPPTGLTEYRWGDDARNSPVASRDFLLILKRKKPS